MDTRLRQWRGSVFFGHAVHATIRRSGKPMGLQIFATDIDTEALEVARAGIYPVSAATELPNDYLRQFFTRDGDHVSVKKSVREAVVFAAQNLITDPPFSRLDFISCRNLLIYLTTRSRPRSSVCSISRCGKGLPVPGQFRNHRSAHRYVSESSRRNGASTAGSTCRPTPVVQTITRDERQRRHPLVA